MGWMVPGTLMGRNRSLFRRENRTRTIVLQVIFPILKREREGYR